MTCVGNCDTVYIEALDSLNFIYFPATTLVITNKVTLLSTGPDFVLTSAQYPAIVGGGPLPGAREPVGEHDYHQDYHQPGAG
jgi:hypothetical protein